MGAKSTNVTSKQMLPLFQVISDLEKPSSANTSLRTSNSNYFFENTSILGSDEIIIHRYSRSEDIIPREFRDLDGSVSDLNVSGLLVQKRFDGVSGNKLTAKRRNKKRRRLKMEQGKEEGYQFKGKKVTEKHRSHHKHKESDSYHKSHKHKEEQFTDASNHTPIKLDRKRTGLFTEMGLSMYKDEGVDISRHFKNISKDDLNSETDNATLFDHSDCPTYEVPKDVIARNVPKSRKNSKRKENNAAGEVVVENFEDSTGRIARVTRSKSKMSTKSIVKHYEEMLAVLLAKCEENDNVIQVKDGHILKMKNKIKELFVFNNQFADENDFLKRQHEDMKVCIGQYKGYVTSVEEKLRQSEGEMSASKGICVNCSTNEITAIKMGRLNSQMSEDLVMLKNVVYRLNVQLLRYQDKLRNAHPTNPTNDKANFSNAQKGSYQLSGKADQTLDPLDEEPLNFQSTESHRVDSGTKIDEGLSIPSLPVFDNDANYTQMNKEFYSELNKRIDTTERRLNFAEQLQRTYSIQDVEAPTAWGDVNAHTLAPLLNSYQESIEEKDQLIRDYESEFNRFTTKLKQVVEENDAIRTSSSKLASELAEHKSKSGMATTERDALRRECEELKEKILQLGAKLKEVHELYEQKVDTMTRDYNLIHEEYFRCKTSLAGLQSRCQMFEEQKKGQQSSIPANVYNNTVQECKRLFEELKNRYEADKERMVTRVSLLQETNQQLERKVLDISCDKSKMDVKAKNGDKLIRKCRKEVAILRGELAATRAARDSAKRRSGHASNLCRQLARELHKGNTTGEQAQQVKAEKILVQKEAMKELDAVESLLKVQETQKKKSATEIARLEDMLRESNATVQAMRQHINKDRLTKYGTTSAIKDIPEEVMKLRFVSRENVNEDKVRRSVSHSNIVPAKGGFVIQRNRPRISAEENANKNI